MSYVPPASLLRGLSVESATCFGMPCVGASYTGPGVRGTRLEDGARCAFCGRPATNAHHVPPVGMGGRNARFTLHGHRLRPALVAVCGSGTTGCHGLVHQRRLAIRWLWDDDRCAEAWWGGELLERFGAGSERLFDFGHWELSGRGPSPKIIYRKDW